MEGVQSLACL